MSIGTPCGLFSQTPRKKARNNEFMSLLTSGLFSLRKKVTEQKQMKHGIRSPRETSHQCEVCSHQPDTPRTWHEVNTELCRFPQNSLTTQNSCTKHDIETSCIWSSLRRSDTTVAAPLFMSVASHASKCFCFPRDLQSCHGHYNNCWGKQTRFPLFPSCFHTLKPKYYLRSGLS
jgi:hypothetical protein